MISSNINRQSTTNKAEEHLSALDQANTTLGLELKEVHECLTIFRVLGINSRKIQGVGAQYLKYTSMLSQRTLVIGLENIFERGKDGYGLCSIRGVFSLAKKTDLQHQYALEAFLSAYGVQPSSDWKYDVEQVLKKMRPINKKRLAPISTARNNRMAHLTQGPRNLTLPCIHDLEQLIKFAHDFHVFIAQAFINSSGFPLDDNYGRSLFGLLKERFEDAKFDFDEN